MCFQIGEGYLEDSEMNAIKHSLNVMCSQFRHECNKLLIVLMPYFGIKPSYLLVLRSVGFMFVAINVNELAFLQQSHTQLLVSND